MNTYIYAYIYTQIYTDTAHTTQHTQHVHTLHHINTHKQIIHTTCIHTKQTKGTLGCASSFITAGMKGVKNRAQNFKFLLLW